MSIFNIEKNSISFSEDWKLFQKFMGNIGAFTYIASEKSAYLDPVACQLLNYTNSKITEFEFFNLLDKISKNPVEGEKHIYIYNTQNTEYYLKMNIFERGDTWLGFIQDYTRQLTKLNHNQGNFDYDSVNGFPIYAYFTQNVKAILPNVSKCCLASVHLNGVTKLGNFLSVENVNHCLASVAKVLRDFTSKNILMGAKSHYEICIFFNGLTNEEVVEILKNMNSAVKNCVFTDDFGELIEVNEKTSLSLSIGCCSFPEQATDFNTLVNYSEFALYDAKSNKKKAYVNWFSEDKFKLEKASYKNSLILSKLIRENTMRYYFQPIVNAINGEIFAYEVLMRSPDAINMSATQIIDIATEQNSLYAIERATLFNSLKLFKKNKAMFGNKKLFINIITKALLSDDDFNALYLNYGDLMPSVVIEMTEQNNPTPEELALIKKRCLLTNAQLAIDDYGTGYSNSTNLITFSPDYIKIDRSLISNIQNDLKKQQLVSSLIDFCNDNNILSLAEGVETSAEMKNVIRMGINFIQGYYTSTPKPTVIDKIESTVCDEIVNTNLETSKHGIKKIYAARKDTEIDLLKLALDGYTDIQIYQSKLTITSDINKAVKINITIMDNHSCELTLKNVNLVSASSKPTINVGNYAQLILIVKKANKIGHSGIYVPQGSHFFIQGDGKLTVDTYTSAGIGIGNDFEHPYGNITIDMKGTLEIISNCEETVCIGGGINPEDSEINIKSGNIIVDMHTHHGVAIGSFNGNSIVNIEENAILNLSVTGIKAVAIGSVHGEIHICIDSRVTIFGCGASSVGIGAIDEACGNVIINGGTFNFKMRSAKNSCIGAWNGNVNVKIKNSVINVDDEGEDVAAIGDIYGSGKVSILDSTANLRLLAATPIDIGSAKGELVLKNNKISSIVNEKTVSYD